MDVLIFTGGTSPDPASVEIFFDRIFKPHYIIAADSGLDTLSSYEAFFGTSFAPNLIIGDMDSLRDSSLLTRYSSAKCEMFVCDKEFTDSELALMRARDVAGSGRVAVLGGCGGRADHFIALYDSFSRDYRADIWLCQEQTVVFLSEGKSLEVTGLTEDDALSVARLTSEYSLSSIEAHGLEWGSFAKSGMASVSNRISHDALVDRMPVVLFAKKGSFLIFLPQSALFTVKGSSTF